MAPSQLPDFRFNADGEARETLIRLVHSAMNVAHGVVESSPITRKISQQAYGLAVSTALQAVNAVLSLASVKCPLDNPAEDIDAVVDGTGRLIYRCYHTPSHSWDLAGNRLP